MPAPPRELIQQVADANDIVDVISGYFPLQRSGSQFKALSPFTNEKSASFYVNPAKQLWYCFSSQQGGDVFKFVQLYENVSFSEAFKKLAERGGVPVDTFEVTPQMEAAERLRGEVKKANLEAADWYHRLLLRSPEAKAAREYLKKRGIGIDVAKGWKLGYAPENSQVTIDWARKAGFSQKALLESGLVRKSDHGSGVYAHFRHRLMFPINNDYGDPIAFSGRVLSNEQKGGKYVNSTESIIFHKSRNFFGLDRSKRAILSAGHAILLEGQLDVITAFEAGIENVIATLGTACTEQHARVLKRHTQEVVICYDADRAGLKATETAFTELAKAGAAVRVAKMPDGEDPDSLIRGDGPDTFRAVIDGAEEFFDFQISVKLSNPGAATIRERAELAQNLAEKVALVGDPMKRDLIVDRLAVRLGVSAEEIQRASREAIRRENRPGKSKKDAAGAPAAKPMLLPESKVLMDLCRVLVTSKEARVWIHQHGDRALLRDIPGAELIGVLWDGDFDPEDRTSVTLFLESLAPEARNAISRIMLDEGPPGGADFAMACWRSLQKRSLENQMAACKARMRDASLSKTEVEHLWKELLDLEKRLKNIPTPQTPVDEV